MDRMTPERRAEIKQRIIGIQDSSHYQHVTELLSELEAAEAERDKFKQLIENHFENLQNEGLVGDAMGLAGIEYNTGMDAISAVIKLYREECLKDEWTNVLSETAKGRL